MALLYIIFIILISIFVIGEDSIYNKWRNKK
jgi:hypothetical protein